MILNKTYGYYSALCSVIGTLLLIITYTLVPNGPKGIMVIVVSITLILSIILLIMGIICSVLAIKNKEPSIKKYIGILLPILIILFIALIPLLMAIGFMLNNNP